MEYATIPKPKFFSELNASASTDTPAVVLVHTLPTRVRPN